MPYRYNSKYDTRRAERKAPVLERHVSCIFGTETPMGWILSASHVEVRESAIRLRISNGKVMARA